MPKHILEHLERLGALHELRLPDHLEQAVHHNRPLKLAREGGQMTAQHLRDLEPARRHATLVAVALDTRATVTDEIVDLHDRILDDSNERCSNRSGCRASSYGVGSRWA